MLNDIKRLGFVGLGAMGGIVAPILADAGLRVVALEAGPWRTTTSFSPDELGAAYYCRATMGPKFAAETPARQEGYGDYGQNLAKHFHPARP